MLVFVDIEEKQVAALARKKPPFPNRSHGGEA
jgi:hypothetical protein